MKQATGFCRQDEGLLRPSYLNLHLLLRVCVEALSGDRNWFTAASHAYEKNELQEVAGAAYSHRFQANISTNEKTSALEGHKKKQGGV